MMKPDDIIEIRRLARGRHFGNSKPIRHEQLQRRLRELCDRNGWVYSGGLPIGPEEGERAPQPLGSRTFHQLVPQRPIVEFDTDDADTIALCKFAQQYADKAVTVTVNGRPITGIVQNVQRSGGVAHVTIEPSPPKGEC